MYIIAGLGNPTSKYERTRHNIGFEAIDIIGKKYGIKTDTAKHKALCGTGIIGGEKVLLLKPQTYMNLSGEAVAEALNYYKLDADNELIVIFDDISLPTGKLRIRRKGSAVRNQLLRMMDRQYKLTGCDKALEIIDQMNPDQLRKYLRERIKVDAAFGQIGRAHV